MTKLHRYPALQPGATVGIFAPGSPVAPQRLTDGRKSLEDLGFQLRVPLDPSRYYGDYRYGFTSESASARAGAFHELLRDTTVSALLAARGAYGTVEILPLIDWALLSAAPRPIVGYSDVTALLVAAYAATGVPTIHGPTLSAEFADCSRSADAQWSVDSLLQLLTDPDYRPRVSGAIVRDGCAEGWVLAANLTLLVSLLGTPYDIDFAGAVLVVEEIGEAPYRVHRALSQLALAGKFRKLAGVAFGRFSKCVAQHGPTVERIIDESAGSFFAEAGCPVVKELPFGHGGKNVALPLGCRARLEASELTLLESPLLPKTLG